MIELVQEPFRNLGPNHVMTYELDFHWSQRKKVFFRGIVHEMLWFIKGDTNIKYLVDNKVNIWNEWPYEIFKKNHLILMAKHYLNSLNALKRTMLLPTVTGN
jgi:thymidylate synthase